MWTRPWVRGGSQGGGPRALVQARKVSQSQRFSQIFETKINVALRRSTECWKTGGRSQHCAKFKFENLKLIQTFNVMKSGFDRSICSAFKLTLLWTWKCNIFGSRRNIFWIFQKLYRLQIFKILLCLNFVLMPIIMLKDLKGEAES